MLCQNCKTNEANVRYTQIINGEKKEMLVCDNCLKEMGVENFDLSMPIDFSSFFESILGNSMEQEFIPEIAKPKELRCSFCNTSYNEFIKSGKLGCFNCYDTFGDKIDNILKRVHGDNKYLGRRYNALNTSKQNGIEIATNSDLDTHGQMSLQRGDSDLGKLQKNLKQAIKEERYEDAAKIRDEIKRMEGGTK